MVFLKTFLRGHPSSSSYSMQLRQCRTVSRETHFTSVFSRDSYFALVYWRYVRVLLNRSRVVSGSMGTLRMNM